MKGLNLNPKPLELTDEALFKALGVIDFQSKLSSRLRPIKIYSLQPRETDQPKSIFEILKKWYPQNYFNQLHYLALKFYFIMRLVFPSFLNFVNYYHFFEWLQHHDPEKPGYRDHLVHVFKVAYLGQWILDKGKPLDNLISLVKSNMRIQDFLGRMGIDESEINEDVLTRAWWLASLFHDIGYAFDFFHTKLEPKVKKMFPFYQTNLASIDNVYLEDIEFDKSLLCGFICGKKGLDWPLTPFNKREIREIVSLINHDLKLNHGTAGALFLLFSYHQIQKTAIYHPITNLIFQLAAEAIYIHDITDSGKTHIWGNRSDSLKFDVKEAPLGCLLILCDEMQGDDRRCLDTRKVCSESVVWQAKSKKPAKIYYDPLRNELKTSIPAGSIIKDKSRFNIDPFIKLNLESTTPETR